MAVSYDQLKEGELLRPPPDLPEPQLTANARKVLERRYLHRIGNRVVETPGGGFWRVAEEIARGGAAWADAETIAARARAYYRMMAALEFLPNSPTLMNAGKGNGLQYSACYVLPVEDSMEGIFDSVKRAALIHKSGGGTGFSFSRLRPAGDIVGSTGGVASGPVSFMEVFNGATESVKQGGTRRGANMGILRVDHPDILQFIDCKRELSDGAKAAYEAVAAQLPPAARETLLKRLRETQIANFNISVAITDRFMQALEADAEYELIHPRTGEVVRTLRARDVFDRMTRAAWETGDPGVVFIDRINAGPANPVPEMGPVEATNPCVTGDTLVSTAEGLRRVRDLYVEGVPVPVLVDGRLSAEPVRMATAVFATGVKPVYRLRTVEGYEVRLTADHRVMTDRGWIRAGDLVPGDRLHIVNRKGGFGREGSAELGQVLGWLVADGTFTAERALLSFFGAEQEEPAATMAGLVAGGAGAPAGERQHDPIGAGAGTACDQARVRASRLLRLAAEHGLSADDRHQVPESVFRGSEAMQRGFLQALFTADGTVAGSLGPGASVCLASSSRALLCDVQRLLLNFGIASTLYTERRHSGLRLLPDGRGGQRPYACQPYHELVITRDNLARFAAEIGFLTVAKQQALLARLAACPRGAYREPFRATFAALDYEGEELVYDLTEPATHSFVANGLVVHNCGEQPLYPNEACNLGSVNLARFLRPDGERQPDSSGVVGTDRIDWERLERTVRLAIRFLDDVINVNPYPDRWIDRSVKANRRVGLGVMGWADLLISLEIPYDSEEALRLAEETMRRINTWAHDESCNLAEERGPFPTWPQSIYRHGRPQRNATVTTIAPTGTISIIAGCSSGIEPLFALVFDRRGSLDGELNLEVNPQFFEIAKREGFWTEDLARRVFERGTVRGLDGVPEKWQRVFGTAHDIAPEWHVRMQAAWQKHVDNAVSKTINLPHDATVEDVARAYRLAYQAGCMGITVYRDGSKEGVLHVGTGGGQPAAAAETSGSEMLPRPKVLQGLTYSVETPLGTAYITINHDERDEPREVFVNQGKAGSDIAALSEAIGKLASIALRIPSSMPPRERLREITRRLRGIGGSSSLGFGPDRTRSLPDALAKVLEEYLEQRDRQEGRAKPSNGKHANGAGHANGGGAAAKPPAPALPPLARYTGELCPDCGTALVYEEGCSKCLSCGFARC
ncbi:MAG TPA: LAGLIDADG family homing endonuclease [Chloroflexota bacterium]|nr:LAGLIDADG family homing endonuclease [Chloroflexota bacterium]